MVHPSTVKQEVWLTTLKGIDARSSGRGGALSGEADSNMEWPFQKKRGLSCTPTSASHGSSEENQASNCFNYVFAAPLSVVDIRSFKSPNQFFSANCSESN
jgi:hypothetical protein